MAFGICYLFNRSFTRLSASITATAAYVLGDSVSATVGVNFPNDWDLDALQFFGSVSENPMIGVGAYLGIAGAGGVTYDASLLPAGINNGVNLYGEGDIGAGLGEGISVTGRSDLSSPGYNLSGDGPGSMSLNIPKIGLGIGTYVGVGVSLNSTAATP